MRITGVRGSIDPTSVADMWMRTRPRDAGRTNQMEMWSLVGLLSDSADNARLALDASRGMDFEEYLYDEPLCGGLMLCSDQNRRDTAQAGIVTNRHASKFVMKLHESGGIFDATVLILPSPLIYEVDDRAMLFGVIQHELRHYMDFLDNDRKPVEANYWIPSGPGSFEIDVDAYARNITEMRAHADEASTLLRIMGGAEKAKKAIKESQFGSMFVMKEAMMAFIDALDAENRATGVKEAIDPAAAVARSEDHDVRALVGHLERMCEVMKFSNNVRQKR
jgi:hypothetical protein